MFAKRLPDLPAMLLDFWPAPPACDRDAWNGLSQSVRAQLIARGRACRDFTWPMLRASDYIQYVETGERASFEERYLARRRILNALVMAECAEGKGLFQKPVIDGVISLCEESGWQLPAHNARQRGGQREPLPDPFDPIIDLYAAETGAQLAVIAALLRTEFDRVDPKIVRRIDKEIELRIILPYLTRHFWWMGDEGRMNNWTAWCTQNVLLAAFVRPTSQAIRRAVVEKAVRSLDAFLKGYGEDGACEEGAFYFRHAGLCLFNALTILDAVAPCAFAPLWREPRLRRIAEYILNIHVSDAHYFNFADCSAVLERCGAREFLFGQAVGSDALAAFAAADWAKAKSQDLPDEVNLFHRIQAAFTAPSLAAYSAHPVRKADIYYPSIGLFIARDDRYALAVKAGRNDAAHGHNDVGSLILFKDGVPFLIDVGVETYTARTFSERRYLIWTMQSAFHNLPTFAGIMQQHGEDFAARDVMVAFTEDEARISMDIDGAYPKSAGLRSYRRTVRLRKGKGVEVEDVHEGGRPAELSLMLSCRPDLAQTTSPAEITIKIDGLGAIGLQGAGTPRIEEIAISDPRLRRAWPRHLYRVLVPLERRLVLTLA